MSASGNVRRTAKASDDYETPPEFYNLVDREFQFTIDGAANERNHKCDRWLGVDGLHVGEQEPLMHFAMWNETVWCNPPYGHGLGKWVDRFDTWSLAGSTVVALLPNGTDTQWFGFLQASAAEVRFLYPRIQFIHPPACGCKACATGEPSGNAGGNMLAIWRQHRPGRAHCWWWKWK